jgi:hypothetical protein
MGDLLLCQYDSAEVSALTEASNDANLGMSLTKTKYTSPASLPGVAGVITTAHFHGIRLCTEIATLMDTFRHHGFDVYVSTASLEDVVAVFATNPKYGYHVKREMSWVCVSNKTATFLKTLTAKTGL